MKRFAIVILVVLATSVVTLAQTTANPQASSAPARKSPLAPYAGTWIGTFDGHVWMSIRLNLQANEITGSMQRARDFKFNNNGGLQSVSEDQITEGVQNAALQGDGLLLTAKDTETQLINHYVLRLTGPDTAELKMVAMEMQPGMPKPLPFKLSRVAANTASTAATAR